MANFVFNIGKGRTVEFYKRAKTADPSTAALLVVLLASTGLETDAVLKDKATLADVVAGTTDESTNTGYARKVLNTTLAALPAPDNVNDRYEVTIPNQTWTAVTNTGTGLIGKLLICYRNATADLDSAVVPLTAHDFVVTPDGSDIIAQVNANGFFRAAE